MSYLGLETIKPDKPMKRGDLYSFPITTIDQIVTNEETNERLPEYLDKITGMDLLWTNASPTSAFVAQTINLNLSNYKFGVIFVDEYIGAYQYYSTIIPVGVKGIINIASFEAGKSMNKSRYATVSTTSITFGDTIKASPSVVTNSTDNIIPYKIYGIK